MIVSGEILPAFEGRGLLVIGDPHIGSRRPGRRLEASWPAPILLKLEHCVRIANENHLKPVILGDLFDRPVERDEALKAQLVRVLRAFRERPLVNVGNHDIQHTTLSDSDSLALLGLCDVIDVVARSGPTMLARLAGRTFGLGMTPYGQPVPRALSGAFAETDSVVWFTHHDIAFGKGYPGAVPPHDIEGCDLVINGHVHTTQRPVTVGATRWLNPGTITRQSVDLLAHVPRAWILDSAGALTAQRLPHANDVFDLTGRLVEPATGDSVAAALESAFVSLLSAEAVPALKRSDDGSLIAEEIEAKFARDGTSDAVRATVRSLLGEAVARRER
jgi:hypothetical protein